jgi:hypothetical protein
MFTLTFSLQNDVNLHHKFFLNLYVRLRKIAIKYLETNRIKYHIQIYNIEYIHKNNKNSYYFTNKKLKQ